jgi:hypothetical protein
MGLRVQCNYFQYEDGHMKKVRCPVSDDRCPVSVVSRLTEKSYAHKTAGHLINTRALIPTPTSPDIRPRSSDCAANGSALLNVTTAPKTHRKHIFARSGIGRENDQFQGDAKVLIIVSN